MQSRTESLREDFEATVLEAIDQITMTDIKSQSALAKKVKDLLRIGEQIKALEQPVNVTGVAREAVKRLQNRVHEQESLQEHRRILLTEIISETAPLFAQALVQHVTNEGS